MNQSFYIELTARCEPAGRPDNEDNFQAAEDLSVSNLGFSGKQIPLGNKGALLSVCDGMGGMNAGEVASAIAIETIKRRFSKENLTEELLSSDENICQYIRETIIQADKDIKAESTRDKEKTGMGSTAVLVWLLGDRAYVAWCGDSRAYRYRPSEGLTRLTHDHSYVQELVDSGELLPELAFDHPNKNIITRSLGDIRKTADPDVLMYDIQDGDIFLLCSDGLHDALRDNEIEQCIQSHQDSMVACKDCLWETSKTAGWMDNVTVVVGQISLTLKAQELKTDTQIEQKPQANFDPESTAKIFFSKLKAAWKKLVLIALVVLACVGIYIFLPKFTSKENNATNNDAIAPTVETLTDLFDTKKLREEGVENAIEQARLYRQSNLDKTEDKQKTLQILKVLIKDNDFLSNKENIEKQIDTLIQELGKK